MLLGGISLYLEASGESSVQREPSQIGHHLLPDTARHFCLEILTDVSVGIEHDTYQAFFVPNKWDSYIESTRMETCYLTSIFMQSIYAIFSLVVSQAIIILQLANAACKTGYACLDPDGIGFFRYENIEECIQNRIGHRSSDSFKDFEVV